jgi:hypothetical protein
MKKIKLPILKNLFLFSITFILSNSLSSQVLDRIYIEGDAVTKFSIGKESRQIIHYRENSSLNLPKNSRFNNSVYGINLSLNYKLNSIFSLGIGSGINVVETEKHPLLGGEYYSKVLLPFFLRFRYQKNISEKWKILSDLNVGYQFTNFRYGNSEEGFDFQEEGGVLANIDLGIGKNIGKYTAFFKLGYELNQFQNKVSLRSIDNTIENNEKVEYKTYFHLVKLSLTIHI